MFELITDHPLAEDSPDHVDKIFHEGEWVQEGGTRLDCSRNHRFNEILYEIMKERFPDVTQLRITDWGCAGGCFIEDCIKDGHLGVGLEGSDYSKLRKRESWGRYPDNYFTCDITHDFQILENGEPCKFDVITSWECLEHLHRDRIPTMWQNVRKHLKEGGLFIGSISDGHFCRAHLTVENEQWWTQEWSKVGLSKDPALMGRFDNQYIRGPAQNAAASFNIVLS